MMELMNWCGIYSYRCIISGHGISNFSGYAISSFAPRLALIVFILSFDLYPLLNLGAVRVPFYGLADDLLI